MQIPRTHTIDSEIRFEQLRASATERIGTMRKIVTMAMLCTVATLGSTAQEPAAAAKQAAEANAIRAKLQVARVGVESRLTKNAPYSAEAVTESVQLLADGNRIVTKNTTHVFRDSEGRTRR